MKIANKIKNIIPFAILFFLLCILWQELFSASPRISPNAVAGNYVPSFQLPNILNASDSFSSQDLSGQVSLVNIWATWCHACGEEHETLMNIKNQYGIPIYGIDYKDNPQAAKAWLKKRGNPYTKVGSDTDGEVGVDFGIYGTPETFVIDANGKIVYRYVGSVNQEVWDSILHPIILKYQQ